VFSVGFLHPDNLHQEASVDVFWKIGQEVYGIDIQRSV
jgi:hypothetical protein